jgi:hypothetical protein
MGQLGVDHAAAGDWSARPARRWPVLWLAAALAACGGGGGSGDEGDGPGATAPPDPPAGALYVGYYVEDAANNPEDPTIGAVLLRLPASDGAFAGQMPFSYAGCAAGSDVGAVRGTRTGAQFSGSWSGTMDGVAVGGNFTLAPGASAGSYGGQWRNAAGKQPIAVGSCSYHVASSGAVTLFPGSTAVPNGVALTVSSSTTPVIGWSGLGSGVRATLRLFDQACLEADPSDAACFLGEASSTAASLAYPTDFGNAVALTAGRSYLWVLTAQAASGAFAGFASQVVVARAADPAPGPGPGDGSGGSDGAVRGRLTIGGSGAAALGGAFVTGADVRGVSVTVVASGPTCSGSSVLRSCDSSLDLSWGEYDGLLPREFVGVHVISSTRTEPGNPPGVGITSAIVVAGRVDGSGRYGQACGALQPCATPADLGIVLDLVARTVTFTNVVLPSQGSDGATIVLDGTLSY